MWLRVRGAACEAEGPGEPQAGLQGWTPGGASPARPRSPGRLGQVTHVLQLYPQAKCLLTGWKGESARGALATVAVSRHYCSSFFWTPPSPHYHLLNSLCGPALYIVLL